MKFRKELIIGDRKIGPNNPVYIIAEAGVSHFGDPGKARELVDLAVEAGADAFKTQAFTTDSLISTRLPEWKERLRPKEVTREFIYEMKERCDKNNITFLCTAHDSSVLSWLDEMNVPAYKIGSGERGNYPFIREISERGKPIILSTGMYGEIHLKSTIQELDKTGVDQVALLHCVTSYPTPDNEVNLRALDRMSELFAGPIGYSDHTEGHQVVLAAVARGAAIVEKHITLDFNIPNAQDWKVSCGPDDFADLVEGIRKIERSLGKKEKAIQPCEQNALQWALKSIVAAIDLPKGTVLGKNHLTAKRPGDGMPPSDIEKLLGKKLVKDIGEDELVLLEHVE